MGPPYPGNWSFKHHPWLKQPHDDDTETIVVQKAAQMGFTEWALNKAFFHLDILNHNVMYILPATTPDASDFSSSRFDPALELSPHLAKLFVDVKNVGHKRSGSANLFIRGSRSESQLRSIPASLLIFDEVDVMVQKNIALAFERVSGQLEKQKLLLSTPTIDQYGINAHYRISTQDHYMFRCPHCNKLTELTFPECLVVTSDDETSPEVLKSHLVCRECKHVLDHASKKEWLSSGEWVSQFTNRLDRGYHVSQLYSTTVRPHDLAISYLRAQRSQSDEQEFYNSKLGVTHIVAGAKITDAMLAECIKSHKKLDCVTKPGLITMGVDVGTWLHYEITLWSRAKPGADIHLSMHGTVLSEGKVKDFSQLDELMQQFRVLFCVIDANPERRMALEFAKRFYGHVKLCFYGNSVNGKEIQLHDEANHTMTVDRTSWLDTSLGRFKLKTISLPVDTSMEYKEHIKSPVRIYKKDGDGNPVGSYVTGNVEDHFAHAHSYCEMALALAGGIGTSSDIVNPL
jgi:Fe2+ or Zn2+ uptake regulation protein